eukprot:m51a1_g9576 hypothetical protein (264) ;mRNA; r:974236-975170
MEIIVDGESNTGEAVVLLHGWPDSAALWSRTVALLTERNYRCYRVTLPGFSPSAPAFPRGWRGPDFPQVVAMLRNAIKEANGGRPVILMAHDWGAVYGYMLEQESPELVSRLVTVDVGGRTSKKQGSIFALLYLVLYQWLLVAAMLLGGLPGDLLARFVAWFVGAKDYAGHGPIRAQMGYPYYYMWRSVLFKDYKPTAPVLYVYGDRKPLKFHTDHWLSMCDRSVPMDTHHWVMIERPDEFHSVLLDWLASPAINSNAAAATN